jgi:glycosyltransferase involved in cell wall biosynthesis
MNVHKVSIICPVYNEEKFIDRCILSILAQDYPKDSLEVLFIDGRSTDRTRELVEKYTKEHDYIRLLDNPQQVVPYALNKGVKESTGEVVMRIDGHCEYPTNYVSELVRYLYELDADNVGGVWNTQPAKETAICQAIALASSHPFGVGGSMHKIGASEIMETDTVPFGCYKREVFEKTGLFDTDLVRNQDDEFNGRLLNMGGKIFLIPQVIINYTARDSICKMRKMYYQYGLYKPLVNKKLGAPATIRQFFPLIFVLGLFVGGIMSCFFPWALQLYVAILAIYLIIGLVVGGMGAIRTHKPIMALLMPYVFFNVHLSYGFGYLRGIFKVLGKKSFNVKANR